MHVGYGSFSMKSVRNLHDEYRKKFAVPTKWTTDFPAYYTYTVRILRQKERSAVGVFGGMTSTGGRIYYSDYSGYAGTDNLMSMRFLGATAAFAYDVKKFVVSPGFMFANYWNSMQIYSYQQLTGKPLVASTTEWLSNTFVIGPTVEVRRSFGPLVLMLNAGYELSIFKEKMHSADQKALFIVDNNKDFIRVSVNGFRVSGGVGIAIGERN